MLSCIVDGKVCDWGFRKIKEVEGMYFFSVGDINLGSVHKLRRGWSAVGRTHLGLGIFPAKGFRSREQAAEFIVQTSKIEDHC